METGISYWFGYPSMPDERIELIKKSGFNKVSLHWSNEYLGCTGDKKEVYDCLDKNDICVSSFHLSYDLAEHIWDLGEKGDLYRKYVIDSIIDASERNVPYIVIHTNGSAESISICIQPLIEMAYKYNVKLCFENLNIEDNLEELIKVFFNDELYFCYDFGHNKIRNSILRLEDNYQIKYFHIHDNDGINDTHCIPDKESDYLEDIIEILLSNKNVERILEVHSCLNNRNSAFEYLEKANKLAKYIDKCCI